VPVIGAIRPSTKFRMELLDEATGERIAHEYTCRVLPVVA
jgi:hypothetical protein